MRCLLLADGDIALREASLLHRLVIGLLDAGVHVTHAAPESVLSQIEPSLGVEILPYRAHGLPWTRSIRAAKLLERFEAATEVCAGDPGLVHAFGGGSLSMAADVARMGDLAFVVDVHARSMVVPVRRLLGERFEGVLLAGGRSITDALLAEGMAASGVRETSWGVTPAASKPTPADETVSIAIGGSGESHDAWARCLRGLAQVAADRDQIAIFADADACERAGVRTLVNALGLSPLFSRVPDFESRRELVVQADLLLWPESLGEIRSVVLDAMSTRTSVIASADNDVPIMNVPGAVISVSGEEAEWAKAIDALVASPERRNQLGGVAADAVREHHSAAAHVGAVVDAYEWATASFARSESR